MPQQLVDALNPSFKNDFVPLILSDLRKMQNKSEMTIFVGIFILGGVLSNPLKPALVDKIPREIIYDPKYGLIFEQKNLLTTPSIM